MSIRALSAVLAAILAASIIGPRAAWSDEPVTITNSIGLKLVRIPAGTFMMGSPRNEPERAPNEDLHEVTLSKPFYLGVYEVTQAQYIEVMKDTPDFSDRSTFTGDVNPAENVEWKLANVFCELLTSREAEKKAGRTYRLPTEAQWEYACRSATSTAFHFGDSLSSEQANINGKYPVGNNTNGKYLRRTSKVGSYQPNAFGLYDMHGNVAEWCADWYDPRYYMDSPPEDPLGPPFGVEPTGFTNADQNFFVVVRGGCWVDEGRACRSACRFRAMPNTQYRLIGFRVACDVGSE